jgi:hypothetical protein
MGNWKTAAVAAALLAVVLIAISLSATSMPVEGQPENRYGEPGIQGKQTRSNLRGQAWATELFGRRYGRNLLAAASCGSEGGEVSA